MLSDAEMASLEKEPAKTNIWIINPGCEWLETLFRGVMHLHCAMKPAMFDQVNYSSAEDMIRPHVIWEHLEKWLSTVGQVYTVHIKNLLNAGQNRLYRAWKVQNCLYRLIKKQQLLYTTLIGSSSGGYETWYKPLYRLVAHIWVSLCNSSLKRRRGIVLLLQGQWRL